MSSSFCRSNTINFCLYEILLFEATERVHISWRVSSEPYFSCGPGSVVGIAAGYGLDGPGDRIPVEGEIFRTCPDRPWGPPSLLYNGYRVFPGGKERSGRDADPSPPSSAVVMKE